MTDYDSAWKEALDRYFRLFLAFFFPEVFLLLDWTLDWEALDTELQQLRPAADVGKRRADKLVKIRRRDNGGEPALIHLEVQCQVEADFERRVYVYNYRIEDRYNEPVVSLVVLGDSNPDWRPHTYLFERWGCRLEFRFPAVKLLDYVGREAELEAHDNPFALLVLTHLQSLATREDAETRQHWKVRLIKGLYSRGFDEEDVRQWYRYFDWLLPLPDELEKQVWEELARYGEEQRVPFVTYAERVGMEKGLEKGLEKGMEKGLEKGMEKGLEKGREEGLQAGLLTGIEILLEVKLGSAGLALLPQIRSLSRPEYLKKILEVLKTEGTLESIHRVLASHVGTNGNVAGPAGTEQQPPA